ncbi:hypothetical protein PGN35_007895 [Nodosilinea sp. PGN35]|uniref:hypothetical protein n=1 Tax=Nodosilinea sp. PGN35 TaxID=3020489 RepID=UPI00398AEA0C
MASPFWLYRLEIPLSVRISVTVFPEEFVDEDVWLIYEGDNHKLLGRIKGSLMGSLLMEAEFPENQDVKRLFQNWIEILTNYLYSIRYLSYEDSTRLLRRESILTENAAQTGVEKTYQYRNLVDSSYLRGSPQKIHFFTKDKFAYLQQAASGRLVDYIEQYVDISALKDPIAKLLGFASLVELINHYVEEKIELPPLFWATRNLVAHGFVSGPDTVNALNAEFEISLLKHEFSRDNQAHVAVIKKEVDEVSKAIQSFIQGQLPQRTTTVYMNS